MSIISKAAGSAFIVFLAVCLMPEGGICAQPDSKLVTRIDTATAVMKQGTLTIRVDAMATTSATLIPKGGKLVRRGEKFEPNKEGLLEYELYFNPGSYTGTKLRLVKASLTEHSVPADIKGVRVLAELNHMDAMLSPKEKKKKEKKE